MESATQTVKNWRLKWESRLSRRESALCELELRARTSADGMETLRARAQELYGHAACTQTFDTVVTFRNGVRVVVPRAGPAHEERELFEQAVVEQKERLDREQINLPFGQRKARVALSEESVLHGSEAASYVEAAKQHLARLRADKEHTTLPRAAFAGCSVFLGTGVGGETHAACGTELMELVRAHWDKVKWMLCTRTPTRQYVNLPFGNLPFGAFIVVIEDDTQDSEVDTASAALPKVAVGQAAPYTSEARPPPPPSRAAAVKVVGVCSVRVRNRTTYTLPRGLLVELTCVLAGKSVEASFEVEVEAVALKAGHFPKLEQFKEACFTLSTLLLDLRPRIPHAHTSTDRPAGGAE
jgi:hypothetical protein